MSLKELEAHSIEVIREAAMTLRNLAALWSGGKDSTAMLYLVKKAFNKIPFPVVQIDNGLEFPDTSQFMEEIAGAWKLDLIIARSSVSRLETSEAICCGVNKIDALKTLTAQKGLSTLMIAIRKDEHNARADAREFSSRDAEWNPIPGMPTETTPHVRVHPLLVWTELDVWRYIQQEDIPINPLYLSVNGLRYRSLGCTQCSSPISSTACNPTEIIDELTANTGAERSGRLQAKEEEEEMQNLRSLGYM